MAVNPIDWKWDKQMLHNNNNLLCSVAIKTTGQKAGYDNLIQVAIIPVNSFIEPAERPYPFYMCIQPKWPEHIKYEKTGIGEGYHKITQTEVLEAMETGLDPYVAAERFDQWFEECRFRFQKRIMPLCIDWPHVLPFIQNWLNQESVEQYFSEHYRDLFPIALYLNDHCDHWGFSAPLAKIHLQYLCSQLKIVTKNARKDTLEAARVQIEIYRNLLKEYTNLCPASLKELKEVI